MRHPIARSEHKQQSVTNLSIGVGQGWAGPLKVTSRLRFFFRETTTDQLSMTNVRVFSKFPPRPRLESLFQSRWATQLEYDAKTQTNVSDRNNKFIFHFVSGLTRAARRIISFQLDTCDLQVRCSARLEKKSDMIAITAAECESTWGPDTVVRLNRCLTATTLVASDCHNPGALDHKKSVGSTQNFLVQNYFAQSWRGGCPFETSSECLFSFVGSNEASVVLCWATHVAEQVLFACLQIQLRAQGLSHQSTLCLQLRILPF